ncbi:uncharacterized protein LOC122499076 isoform X2 [Leptopilina heterotoma]|uniref:uncharacterized protein LOC122499076 isoform X2 n=1 Tax=Leptopilina heterotoma TaxID=63436 RepID=UPI001CA905F3|nr:uncharacterized protein LOC122499076 isoform X2 [Leptopilina heterotoma]
MTESALKKIQDVERLLKDLNVEEENSLKNYINRCLYDQEDLLFQFYIISCQLKLLLSAKILSRPYLNKILNKILTDVGILDPCNRVQLFCALHPLDIFQLNLLLKKGFAQFGLKMPNLEYRKFIADPTIPLPYTYANKEKTLMHKAESGLFNNKRKKGLMDNPFLLKLFLRAVWIYKDEIYKCFENNELIPLSILKDIAFKTKGNTTLSNRQSTVLFIATCSFTIYSNREILQALMEVFDESFTLEYREKIMFKFAELFETDEAMFLDLLNERSDTDSSEYPLFYNSEQITPFRTGSVNTFFGPQYPISITTSEVQKETGIRGKYKRVLKRKPDQKAHDCDESDDDDDDDSTSESIESTKTGLSSKKRKPPLSTSSERNVDYGQEEQKETTTLNSSQMNTMPSEKSSKDSDNAQNKQNKKTILSTPVRRKVSAQKSSNECVQRKENEVTVSKVNEKMELAPSGKSK